VPWHVSSAAIYQEIYMANLSANNTTYINPIVQNQAAKNLVQFVKPTHFITISLVQARTVSSTDGKERMIRGDDILYGKTHERFITALSKKLTPSTTWKRRQPKMVSACTVEGGTKEERYHLHLIIAKREAVSEEEFLDAIKAVADGNPWIMNGEHRVDVQMLEDNQQAFRAASYITKRGLDRVLLTGPTHS
jgi:hypothetical protein